MSSPAITGRAIRSEIRSFAIRRIGAAAAATGPPVIGATETGETAGTAEIGVEVAATEDAGAATIVAAGAAIDARVQRKSRPWTEA